MFQAIKNADSQLCLASLISMYSKPGSASWQFPEDKVFGGSLLRVLQMRIFFHPGTRFARHPPFHPPFVNVFV
jgi:hypothetical protein